MTNQKHKQRDRLKALLEKEGIGATVYYDPPIHRTPFYDSEDDRMLPNTEWQAETVLSLPVHPQVTGQDIEKMADIIKNGINQ